jgi:hypothetical protein
MAVIQFAEVVQGTKTDLDAEKRIQEKEAIYRGLIEQEARLKGKNFEDFLAEAEAQNERLEAEPETKEAIKIVAEREALSIYETKLNGRIEIQEIILSAQKKEPHPLMWLANEN